MCLDILNEGVIFISLVWFFCFEEDKMEYITECLKISAQGVSKTQLKQYQIQSKKYGEQKQEKPKKRATLLHNNSQER